MCGPLGAQYTSAKSTSFITGFTFFYTTLGYIWIKSGYIPFFQLYSLLFQADVGNDEDDYHDIIVMAIDCFFSSK